MIGLPASFLQCKKSVALPDDVWLVDLDTRQITPAKDCTLADIPALPEPEAKVLKNHLKQVEKTRLESIVQERLVQLATT